MRSIYLICLILFLSAVHCIPLQKRQQQVFMTSQDHGEIWSLCDNPTTHTLKGYQNGVSITPAFPRTGDDITVQVRGHLCNDVTNGHVDIQLNLMNMIKINKELDYVMYWNQTL
ncbi:unnamed protein product [Absidia cylindrospora]